MKTILDNIEFGKLDIICPFCGEKMGWDSDYQTGDFCTEEELEELGIHDSIVMCFGCANCQAGGEVSEERIYRDDNGQMFNASFVLPEEDDDL